MRTRKFDFIANDGGHHSFKVRHNLSAQFGLNINDAFASWQARTDNYSVHSFCEYVQSKDAQFKCVPVNY